MESRITFNSTECNLSATPASFGLAYLPEDMVRPHVDVGRLRQVLDDRRPLYPGYHLYSPSRASRRLRLRCWWRRCGIEGSNDGAHFYDERTDRLRKSPRGHTAALCGRIHIGEVEEMAGALTIDNIRNAVDIPG